jgi:hypothetical protein
MDLTVFGFEPGTSARILVVGATTIFMLAFITAAARRLHSYWWVSIALIVASCASLALGGYFAVRIFMGAVDNMAKTGGGIASVRFAIWQATQPALAAAWIALVTGLLASALVLPRASKELTSMAGARRPRAAIFASLAAFALVVGAAPGFLFRRAMAFVLWVIIPPAHVASVSQAIATRLHVTAAVSASCFIILILLVVLTMFLARRSSPSRLLFVITVFALVVSLGLSAALVANLYSFSNLHHRGALMGGIPLE